MNDDAVWAETTDGGLLKQLFGFYPTLHHATIVSIDIDRLSDRIALVVDYSDKAEEGEGQDLTARIRLEWQGIASFEIPLGETDLHSLSFGRKGNQIVTSLETWPGVFGKVVSESVEAILVQLDPGDPEENSRLRYR